MRQLLTKAEITQYIRQNFSGVRANFLAMDVGNNIAGLTVTNIHDNDLEKPIRPIYRITASKQPVDMDTISNILRSKLKFVLAFALTEKLEFVASIRPAFGHFTTLSKISQQKRDSRLEKKTQVWRLNTF